TIPPLPKVILEPLVRAALCEDLGRAGDLTSDAIVPLAARARMCLVARQAGVVAGLDLVRLAFRLMDDGIEIRMLREDGARLAPGDVVTVLEGRARAMLSADRTASNFLGHLSGVATATAAIADATRAYGTRVSCTRKTLPELRAIQKYA